MEISLDELKGYYLPTFLDLYINTSKELDLNKFSKDEMGTFCHEWIHFIQDVTTGSGCNNSYVFFEHFLACAKKIKEDGIAFTPPVNVENAFNVETNEELNRLAWGKDPLRGFTRINDVNVVYAKDVAGLTIRHKETEDFPVAITTTDTGDFQIGMKVLMESMAHLCQDILCPGTTSNHPLYPYHVAELICETICPGILDDPLNLIALCDVSLMSSAPGAYFLSYLKGISQNQISMPTSPENIYDHIYSNPDFLPKFHEIVHHACHHFLGILIDPQVFKSYRYWIKHTYLNAVRLRSKNRYFLLELLRNGTISQNSKFMELLHLFGTPLMHNNNGWFGKISLEDEDKWDVEFLQVIKQIDEIFNNKRKNCALVEWCKSSAQYLYQSGTPKDKLSIPDASCNSNPTLRSTFQPQCPFGLVWYAMNLPLMKG